MVYKIKPYTSVGEIKFGMDRKVIRDLFKNNYEEFRKSPFSENTTDDFGICHVYYNNQNKCEAVEFFDSANVSFMDMNISNKSYYEVKVFFKKIDQDIDINEEGFTSYKYGIGVYAPFALNNPKEIIEGIIVFQKNYYAG